MAGQQLQNARVLVTGASSGIGRELAIQLACRGVKLLLTARREDRLRSLSSAISAANPNTDVSYVAGDISDSEHRTNLVAAATARFEGLDILVNNAGIGASGPFEHAAPNRLRQIMEVNFFAAAELIRLAIPLLKQNHHATIVNIGSVLAFYAVPKKSEYCASKFALKGFSDALRIELQDDNVTVISVHPNTTKSEFFDHLIEQDGQAAKNPLSMSAENVARKIVRAIDKGKPEVVLTASGKSMIWLSRIIPGTMQRLLRNFG